MESDLANPAALAWFDTVDESALETSIRPHAVFADVEISGTFSNDAPVIIPESNAAPVAVAAPGTVTFDQKWIAVLAIVVIAIGVIAIVQNR